MKYERKKVMSLRKEKKWSAEKFRDESEVAKREMKYEKICQKIINKHETRRGRNWLKKKTLSKEKLNMRKNKMA